MDKIKKKIIEIRFGLYNVNLNEKYNQKSKENKISKRIIQETENIDEVNNDKYISPIIKKSKEKKEKRKRKALNIIIIILKQKNSL